MISFDQFRILTPPDPVVTFAGLPLGDNGERFDFRQSPWVKAVLDWWLDPAVEWIYLIQGSQTSKTTTMMGLLLYSARHDPGNAMWVGAVEEEVQSFVTDRLKPFLEQADPAVKGDRKRDWRRRELRLFGTSYLHVGWSTSATRLRSWPCRYVFGDECGIWPASIPKVGDPIEYLKKRTRKFRRRKGIFATTPGTEWHPSWQSAKRSNFARWFVPCPECGKDQFLSFRAGVNFEGCKTAGAWDLRRVLHETAYVCEGCGCVIPESAKADMISAGRVAYVDLETGLEVPLDPGNTSRALQIPATYSLFTTWGKLAVTFLESLEKGPETLRVFITDELAEPYEEAGERPDLEAVRKCIDADRNPGCLPDHGEVIGLTCGVDVQERRVYWVVRAFGFEDRSWLLAYGWIPREGERALDLLNPVIFADYQGKPVNLALIDSGYDKDAVYNYCRLTGRRAVPSKGRAEVMDLVRLSPQDKSPDGKADQAGLLLAVVNVTHWKTVLHERIAVQAGHPREWRLHNGTEDDYMVHMISEFRRPRPGRGPLQYEWVHDKRYPNHYFDCEVMALAAAKLMGWNFVQRQAAAPPRQAAPRVATEPRVRNPWEPQSLGHLIG